MNSTEEFNVLSAQFIEKDDMFIYLSSTGKLELEALFMSKIGNRKLDLLNLQLEIKSVQRKTEEFKAALSRNEKPSLVSITALILIEMAEAKDELLKQKEIANSATNFLLNLDRIQNPEKLREIYRRIARKIHPDVRSENSERMDELWFRVRDAYENGDVEALQSIEIVYSDLINQENSAEDNSEKKLAQKIEFLKHSIKNLDEKLLKLKETFPFNIEYLLRNEELVEAELNSIEKEIEEHEKYFAELKHKFEILTEQYGE